ncbi:glycosyl transferase [Brenneria sp. 4F2]|nr:glycosyl transferase [Brenneria bubanii]
MKSDIVILVVLYNKKIEDSTTIRTLCENNLNKTTLIIHNNGPHAVDFPDSISRKIKEKFDDVIFLNTTENKPLSFLYNDTIDKYDSTEKFVFFDDDSQVTDSFVRALYADDYDIEMPRIISLSDNLIYYPQANGKVVQEDDELDPFNLFSIGSGLIIHRRLIDKFRKNRIKLFDEHYALYGVDFSLFRNIYALHKSGEVFNLKTSSFLYHSLSRTEGKDPPFRKLERLIDFALTVRWYPSLKLYFIFFAKCIRAIFFLRWNEASVIISTYIRGNHPRCQKWLSEHKK